MKPFRFLKLHLAALLLPLACLGADFTVLRTFQSGLDDGYRPGQVVADGSTLYGTLAAGSSPDYAGAIYGVNMDGTGYGLIHRFAGSPSFGPSKLTLAGSRLYGASGASNDTVIFGLGTDGSAYQVLCTVSGGYGGANLLVAGSKLYGLMTSGGTTGLGQAFRVNLDGSGYEFLHQFDVQAANPQGALVASGSTLYGVAQFNGGFGQGAVFRMNLDGSGFALVHSFGDGADGAVPVGGLTQIGSLLFGVSRSGGAFGKGTVYRINLDGTGYTILHHFSGAVDDQSPNGSLKTAGDKLYGLSGQDTLFRIGLDGTGYARVYQLTSSDNNRLSEDFVVADGTIYGVTLAERGSLYGISNIPEPGTLALLSLSALGLLRRPRSLHGLRQQRP